MKNTTEQLEAIFDQADPCYGVAFSLLQPILKGWKIRRINIGKDWPSDEAWRLWHEPFDKGGSGFDLCVLSWVRSGEIKGNMPNDIWDCEDLCVENVVYGTITFDGPRHFYWGDHGYMNYPSSLRMIELHKVILELTKEFCHCGEDIEFLERNKGRGI